MDDALKALPDVDDVLGQHFPLKNGHTSFFVERRASQPAAFKLNVVEAAFACSRGRTNS